MDIKSLKINARQINKESKSCVYKVAFAYVAIMLLITALSTRLTGVSMSQSEMTRIMDALNQEQYEYVENFLMNNQPEKISYVIDVALRILQLILSVGFSIFTINTIRHANPELQNILDGFGFFFKAIMLYFLIILFVILWSFLLIVPGIVAAYRYRQARYLMIDHPDWSVLECISKSKEMMKGHKMELFLLDLSFLGWAILQAILVPLQIYTVPYFETTYVLYYQQLAGIPEIAASYIPSED